MAPIARILCIALLLLFSAAVTLHAAPAATESPTWAMPADALDEAAALPAASPIGTDEDDDRSALTFRRGRDDFGKDLPVSGNAGYTVVDPAFLIPLKTGPPTA